MRPGSRELRDKHRGNTGTTPKAVIRSIMVTATWSVKLTEENIDKYREMMNRAE